MRDSNHGKHIQKLECHNPADISPPVLFSFNFFEAKDLELNADTDGDQIIYPEEATYYAVQAKNDPRHVGNSKIPEIPLPGDEYS
uniref:Uncharacterized protein n=1 Tax=Parascaris equorum TaxID=6256 RepID=A0A914RIH2_PAREQ